MKKIAPAKCVDIGREKMELSFLSNLTILFSSICVFPVMLDLKHSKAYFSWLSTRILVFFGLFFISSVGIIGIFIPVFSDLYIDLVQTIFTMNNYVDIGCQFAFFAGLYFITPFSLLLLASAFPNLAPMSMHQDLRVPKNLTSLLFMLCLSLAGPFLVLIGMYLGLVENLSLETSSVASKFIPLVIVPYTSLLLPLLAWGISVFFASSWISKLIDLCHDVPDHDIIHWSTHCLSIYNSLESHLGTFLCFMFSLSQVFWIFTIYMSITGYFADFSLLSVSCYSAGMGLFSLGILANILGFSGLIESAHQSLQGMVKTLENHSLRVEDRREMLSLTYHIKEIEKTRPLSGRGLFLIDRSIITGMVSVAVTYIIILAQFRMSLDN